MYKFERYRQLGLADFNQPVGLKMNLENCRVKKAATIPRDAIEDKYANLFPGREMEAGVIPAMKRPTSLKTAERLSLMQPAHLRT